MILTTILLISDFPDICANNGTCVNVFADFKCVCTEEWTGKECDCLKGIMLFFSPCPV